MMMSKPKLAILAIPVLIALTALVMLSLHVWRTVGSRIAPELPRKIPAPSLTVRRLYGKATPLPVPLYGPGRIHGSFLEATETGGTGATILEGVYASPDVIARFYRDQLAPLSPKHYRDDDDPNGRTIHLLFETKDKSGRLGVFIMTDPAGISRDVNIWRSGSRAVDHHGGDPKETMVLVSAIWRPRKKEVR